MSKTVKALMTRELKDRFAGVTTACVVDLTGLNVQAQEKLRRTLRKKSARLEVVKNSLARHAFAGGPLEALGNELSGPCAVITTGDTPVEVAKLLIEAAKEFTALKLKHAVYDGDRAVISIATLSKMRSRTDLLGEIANLIGSPGRRLAACLRSPQSKIAGCLKALIEKGDGGAPEAAAAA